MKWLLPVLLAAGIFAAAIVPAWQDRSNVIGRVAVPTCANDLGADAGGSTSLTWRLRLADDFGGMGLDLNDDQLIALGFDRHAVSMLGQERPKEIELPRARPVWVRLRSSAESGGRLVVDSVASTRAALFGKANTIVVHARVGFSYRGETTRPVPKDSVAAEPQQHEHQQATLKVDVFELMPSLLHLTAGQDAALQKVQSPGFECKGSSTHAVIAMGKHGSLWVERVGTD